MGDAPGSPNLTRRASLRTMYATCIPVPVRNDAGGGQLSVDLGRNVPVRAFLGYRVSAQR